MALANEFEVSELLGEAGALELGRLPAFDGVRAAFSTRLTEKAGALASFAGPVRDGEGRLSDEYIARLAATLGFAFGRLGTCRQVHSAALCGHDVGVRRWYEGCDGLVTNLVGAPIAVFTADCVAILLWAPAAGALALVHAGWRGTTAKILARAVALMHERWGAHPAEISAFLGPAIGPCCYEVGEDVAAAARAALGPKVGQVLAAAGDRYRFDLHRTNILIAQEAGLTPLNIYRVLGCTSCDADHFPSWRRDGESAGRIAAFVERKGAASGN